MRSGRWAIALPLREYDPGDACSFIGLGHPSPIFPPSDEEALKPAAPPVLLALHRPDHCSGPMDEQLPEIAIAPLADSGGVSNVDIDGKNALQIKAIGVVIATVETLPDKRPTGPRH